MKKLVLSVGACTLLMPGFAAAKDKTFTGEIMDSQCAKNSSHTMMLKKEGMGDKDPNDPMVKQMCTKYCVTMGGKYVLYDAAQKGVYELTAQQKPVALAGQLVRVTGTLDAATKPIHVKDVRAVS